MKLDAIVFDLDGTLWDTCAACALGWNNVLERRGISWRAITAQDVRSVAGKPHAECIRQVFRGLSEAQLAILSEETATEDVRCIEAHGGELYAGVREGLAQLATRYPLFIVSNCQAGYIELFLHNNGFGPLFRDIECWGNTGLSKAENLQRVITRNGLASPVFVGDTEGDQSAADSCNVPFVHVAYGFGQCPSAAQRVHSFPELCALFLNDVRG
ncbi:MAG TPA: HAD family hydrolase [Polyangiales bacterium]|nr:HAD family hydrolase [Polyangiales bacterium]